MFARKNDTENYTNKIKPTQWLKIHISSKITTFLSKIRSFFVNDNSKIIKEIGKKGEQDVQKIDQETVYYSKNNNVQLRKGRQSNDCLKDMSDNKRSNYTGPTIQISSILQEKQLKKSIIEIITTALPLNDILFSGKLLNSLHLLRKLNELNI